MNFMQHCYDQSLSETLARKTSIRFVGNLITCEPSYPLVKKNENWKHYAWGQLVSVTMHCDMNKRVNFIIHKVILHTKNVAKGSSSSLQAPFL